MDRSIIVCDSRCVHCTRLGVPNATRHNNNMSYYRFFFFFLNHYATVIVLLERLAVSISTLISLLYHHMTSYYLHNDYYHSSITWKRISIFRTSSLARFASFRRCTRVWLILLTFRSTRQTWTTTMLQSIILIYSIWCSATVNSLTQLCRKRRSYIRVENQMKIGIGYWTDEKQQQQNLAY